jgi:hypothetical protein
MRTDKAYDGLRQLGVEVFGCAGHAEGGGESVIVAVFELLRHNVHPYLIFIEKRDRQQNGTIPQDWNKLFEHGSFSSWILIFGC